jgi:pyridoxamine 5'-phosphate oxidase
VTSRGGGSREQRPGLGETIAFLGRGHADVGLAEGDLAARPADQFAAWMGVALDAGLILPNSMTLATATKDGAPSARIVLLKGFDDEGFVFYTNHVSRKGRELAENPRAALVWHWAELERQVRAAGSVETVTTREAEAYWRTRPVGSRLGAWASPQSEVIAGRGELDRRLAEAEREHGADPPLPPFWGGYRLRPEEVEFWQGRRNRLHDRLRYRRAGRAWVVERLAP